MIPVLLYFETEAVSIHISYCLSREKFCLFETKNAALTRVYDHFAHAQWLILLPVMAAPIDLELKKVKRRLQIYSEKLNGSVALSL